MREGAHIPFALPPPPPPQQSTHIFLQFLCETGKKSQIYQAEG